METITINGKEYVVYAVTTAEHLPTLRAEMDRCGIDVQLYIHKPNGKKLFITNRYKTGEYRTPTAIPMTI